MSLGENEGPHFGCLHLSYLLSTSSVLSYVSGSAFVSLQDVLLTPVFLAVSTLDFASSI